MANHNLKIGGKVIKRTKAQAEADRARNEHDPFPKKRGYVEPPDGFNVRSHTDLTQRQEPQMFTVAKFNDTRRGPFALLQHAAGPIYSTRSTQPYDIRSRGKDERAAWCRLTGMTNTALDRARRDWQREQAARRTEDAVEHLRDEADALGYNPVKQ